MKALPFTKMQAQGNDFIILNGLETSLPKLDASFVRTITERRYGIGCDQLLVLDVCDHADATMRIFNNDGTEAGNCGNGLRCVGSLLMASLHQDSVQIALRDRVVTAKKGEQGIAVHMGQARITAQNAAHVDVDMGNPHTVFFEATEDVPNDRNIEIVTGQVADHVYIDIIERGSGRTPACGSGACATAAAIWHTEQHHRPQTIEMPGGQVLVSGSLEDVVLEGLVHTVFQGHYSAHQE